jgi:hypothetical protein
MFEDDRDDAIPIEECDLAAYEPSPAYTDEDQNDGDDIDHDPFGLHDDADRDPYGLHQDDDREDREDDWGFTDNEEVRRERRRSRDFTDDGTSEYDPKDYFGD